MVHPTIDSLLKNAEGDIEVIVTLDGAPADRPITDDPRVKTIYFPESRGMREAINAAVAIAEGEHLMRTDSHCMFAERFDTILIDALQPNEIAVPRRYFLDPDKWEVMDMPPVDYEKLVIDPKHNKFSGQRWSTRTEERKDIPYDETMAMQGSCWIMHKKWWEDVIGELQSEGYGTHYQDSHEMVFKTWKAGGRLMLNKNTWYAHKHRNFKRTHSYPGDLSRASWDYSLKVWRDYYENEIRPKWNV